MNKLIGLFSVYKLTDSDLLCATMFQYVYYGMKDKMTTLMFLTFPIYVS